MLGVTIFTSLKVSLLDVLPRLIQDPWTAATLVDFYFNILILWSVVVYKENSMLRSLGWLVAFIALGSIATSAYVFIQLCQLKPGDSLTKLFVRRV
jgi:hypothetical protein